MVASPMLTKTTEHENIISKKPQFWDMLSDADKNGYKMLQSSIIFRNVQRSQHFSIESFQRNISMIKKYAERSDQNDWKRFLVCGICWVDNYVAVNIRQLQILISKCKSSINGSIQKLGYLPAQSHVDIKKCLAPLFQYIKNDYRTSRQWTVRYKMQQGKNAIDPPKVIPSYDQNIIQMNQNSRLHTLPLIVRDGGTFMSENGETVTFSLKYR